MKIRHIIAIVAIIFAVNGVNNALKRSDFNHCRVTTHHTLQECKDLTGYTPE